MTHEAHSHLRASDAVPPPESERRKKNPFDQKLPTPWDLVQFLQQSRDPNIDPHKPDTYEHKFFQRLFAARLARNDQAVRRIRGFLKAAMHFRTTPHKETPLELINVVHTLGRISTDHHAAHINQGDPSHAQDHIETLEEEKKDLAVLEHALVSEAKGEELEAAVRIAEDLEGAAWNEFRKFQIYHGSSWNEALNNTNLKPVHDEIRLIQKIRDALYLRLLAKNNSD